MRKNIKKQFLTMSLLILCFGLFLIVPFWGDNSFNNVKDYSDEYIEFLNSKDKTAYGDVVPMQYKSDYQNSKDIVEASTLESYYCLRDYYQIYTKQQDVFGLCWAYASTTSLETMIAINYGEFYNFSPAWTGLSTYYLWRTDSSADVGYKDYEIGGGGNFNYFQTATTKTGLLLETDFDLNVLNRTDASNYDKIFNDYKDKYINLGINYSKVSITKRTNSFYTQVKNHIKANGSLYASCYSKDIDTNNYSLYSKSGSATHAVSIIGWDDNYQASGWTNAGAWIALNSWGNNWGYDGIFYISYKDVVTNTTMYGVKPSSSSINISVVSESNTPIPNHYIGKYSVSSPTDTNGTINNKNIFKSGSTINITYKFSNSFSNSNYTVYKYDINCTNNFTITNRTSDTISIRTDNASPGTYKVKFTNANGATITKEIVVIDGLEIGYMHYNSPKTSDKDYPGTDMFFGNYNSFNQEVLNFEIFTQNYAYFHIYLPSFSTLKSVECIECTANNYVLNKNKLTFATYNSYAKGDINFSLSITEATGSATLRLTSLDGQTKDLHLTAVYYPSVQSIEQSIKFVYIIPDYDGATDNRDVPALKVTSNYHTAYLPRPSKGAYIFDGWYYDENFYYPLSHDYHGYFISYWNNYIYDCNGQDNYYTGYNDTPFTFSYVYIYAKWRDPDSINVTFVFDDNIQIQTVEINSDVEVPEIFNTEVTGYELVWDKNLKNVTNTMTVRGQLKLLNANLDDIKIDGDDKNKLSATYMQDVSHWLNVTPTHIKSNDVNYEFTWLYSLSPDGRYKPLETTSSELELTKAKDTGYYKIQVKSIDTSAPELNNNEFLTSYSTALSDAIEITIDKANTYIETYGITTDFTYNGKYQSIEENATITRDEENENIISYENNSFKNVGSGTHIVTIRAKETENYKGTKVDLKVTIHPANVSVKIHNKRSALFSETAKFSYEVRAGSTIYDGDNLDIQFLSNVSALSAGKYNISAQSLNGNYNVNVIDGEYEVYYETLSFILIIVIMVVLAGLLGVTSYFIVTKIIMLSYLKDSRIDREINDM